MSYIIYLGIYLIFVFAPIILILGKLEENKRLSNKSKCLVFKTDQVVCIDCDDTLVMWALDDTSKNIPIEDPYIPGVINYVTPHEKHVKLVQQYKGRGFTVIVWSAGGVEWAHNVVKALKLEDYVDIVLTKPSRYVDDLPCGEWMGNRVYLQP